MNPRALLNSARVTYRGMTQLGMTGVPCVCAPVCVCPVAFLEATEQEMLISPVLCFCRILQKFFLFMIYLL